MTHHGFSWWELSFHRSWMGGDLVLSSISFKLNRFYNSSLVNKSAHGTFSPVTLWTLLSCSKHLLDVRYLWIVLICLNLLACHVQLHSDSMRTCVQLQSDGKKAAFNCYSLHGRAAFDVFTEPTSIANITQLGCHHLLTVLPLCLLLFYQYIAF